MATDELHVHTGATDPGPNPGSAAAVTLTAAQKEKITKAVAQAILDETGIDPRQWLRFGFSRGI